jgi:hypothetical protein
VIDDVTLREIAVKTGVPLGTIEKDLAITCTLKAISTTRLKNHMHPNSCDATGYL